jgi:hypothetical protein
LPGGSTGIGKESSKERCCWAGWFALPTIPSGIDIAPVGGLANRYRALNLIKKLVYLSIGAKYHWFRDRLVVSSFGAQLEVLQGF